MTQVAPEDAAVAGLPLVVPAYFHPASHPREWQWLAEHSARLRMIVLNMDSGPGHELDTTVLPALERLRAAGVTVCGYVDTDYGQRPPDDAVADFRRHVAWYQVDGVFFDRAATGPEQVGHYTGLARRAREAGAQLVAFNHGARPVEAYADHADLLGTFEGPWNSYLELAVPRWIRARPAGQFFHLLHSVPTESGADAWWLAARRHAGCAYITNRTGANPWDGLPAGEIGREAPLASAAGSMSAGGA